MRTLTVLLAEDEPIISMHIKLLLEEIGLQVIQMVQKRAITAICQQIQPDLVILNFNLQDAGNGMSVAQALKQRFNLPVMLITGARPEDITTSKDFDPSVAVMYKPFTRTQVRQFVHRFLD